jgi:hypothetical protein
MADTGFKSPTTCPNTYWTNPTNAFASDDARATATGAGDYQQYRDFGFDADVPSGATILGIEVEIEGNGAVGGEALAVQLSPDGSSWGNDGGVDPTFTTGADVVRTCGGATNLWLWFTGARSQILDANFRLRIIVPNGGQTVNVDHVRVKVYYDDSAIEQEGYRFRDDDAGETAATWLANQDTAITRAKNLNTRIRALMNATSDPAAQNFRLEYKKSGDSEYEPVLKTPTTLKPWLVNIGNSASGTGTVAPTLPASLIEGDLMLLFVETENQTISAPSGWTEVADSPQGTGTAAAADAVGLQIFYRRFVTGDVAPTVADSGDHTYARIAGFRGVIATGDPWDVTVGGVEATADTSASADGDTTTVDNCLVVVAIAHEIDSSSAQFSAWANADLDDLAEISDAGTSSGDGGGIGVATGIKAVAGAFGVTTATVAASTKKAFVTIALKPAPNPVLAAVGSGSSGSGNVTPSIPSGYQEFDILLLFCETNGQAVTAPTGWTAVADSPQSTGSGTTGTRLSVFWKRAGITETNPTITDPGDHVYAIIHAFRGCPRRGNPWDVTSGNVEAGSDTSGSIDGDTTTVDNTLIVLAITRMNDTSGAEFSAWANADLAALAERSDTGTTSGDGGGIGIATGVKASAGAYGATTVTLAVTSVKAFMSIALKSNKGAMILSPSSNIAAGGANTTVQLTAPSGKSTSDFVAGRIQDDENPADAVNITTDDYTEIEWCIKANDNAADTEVYNFRVTKAGTPVDTYTVTIEWTIGTPTGSVTKTHTTDALIKTLGTKTHTTDASLRGTSTKTHTVDSDLKGSLTKIHTTDSDLKGSVTKSHTTDADIQGSLIKTHASDADLKGVRTQTHTTDALLRATKTQQHTTDADIKGSISKTHSTDADLKGSVTKNHSTDSGLVGLVLKTHTTDSDLKGTVSKSHSTDSDLKGSIIKTHQSDALLLAKQSRAHTTNVLLRAIKLVSHSVDSLLRATITKVHTTDADVKGTITKSHSTDADIKGTVIKSHFTDADLKGSVTKLHTTDADLKGARTKSHSSDADLKGSILKTHWADTLLRATQQKSHTTDSDVKGALMRSHSTDADIKGSITKAHTVDSDLKGSVAKAHQADSDLKGSVNRTHTTNALLRAAQTKAHTTDALKQAIFGATHTTDSLFKGSVTKPHTTDAFILRTFFKSHTTDAYKYGQFGRAHATDSYLRRHSPYAPYPRVHKPPMFAPKAMSGLTRKRGAFVAVTIRFRAKRGAFAPWPARPIQVITTYVKGHTTSSFLRT